MSDLTKKLWFAYITALAVWGLCGFGLLGKWQYEGTLFARRIDNKPYTNDFVNMYSAALLARQCLTGPTKPDVYDINVQAASVAELTKPIIPELPFYFQYPPYAFVLALPLSVMPMFPSWLAWDLTGLGLSAWALWMVAKQCFQTPFRRTFAMVAAFGSFPAWMSAQLGQPALFACAGVTGFFLCVFAKRPYLAALCTIPVMVKIQYLPVVGLIGTLMLGLPYALATAAILLTLVLWAVAILGPANVMDFPHALSQETTTAVSGVAAEMMQNLRGELTLLMPQSPDVVKIVSFSVWLLTTVALSFIWFSMKRKGLFVRRETLFFAAAMTTLAMLMTSVHTHTQDYWLTAAPCMWLYMLNTQWSAGRPAKAARVLVVSFPFVSWIFFMVQPLVAHFLFIQPFLWWNVALFVLSFLNLRRHLCASPES